MRLSLAQIETFYWIARLGSFHAAAAHLCVTQPSISGRIRELERELGCQVFDRSGSRVRLTDAGKAIQHHSEQVLSLMRNIYLDTRPDKLRGLLRLGVVETVAHVALPGLMRQLNTMRPSLHVELSVDVGSNLLQALNDRRLDVAVTTDAVAVNGIRVAPLRPIDLAWIGPVDHPLAGKTIRPEDLVQQVIFTQPPASTIGTTISNWFRQSQSAPQSLNLCNSLSVTSELIAAGLGFAVMTPALLREELRSRVHVFSAIPALPEPVLSIAALEETWSDDILWIGHFIAEKWTIGSFKTISEEPVNARGSRSGELTLR